LFHTKVRHPNAALGFYAFFIVVRFPPFVVIFQVVFEVSLLVEVRLRGSLSARSAIPNLVFWESLSLPARTQFSPLLLVFPSTTTKLQSSNVIIRV
jgi:hypothetical protein